MRSSTVSRPQNAVPAHTRNHTNNADGPKLPPSFSRLIRFLLIAGILLLALFSPLYGQQAGYSVIKVANNYGNRLEGALNDSSEVVGTTLTPQGVRAFYWKDSMTTILPVLPGATYSHAWGINNNSIIVGSTDDLAKDDNPVYWQNGAIVNIAQDP